MSAEWKPWSGQRKAIRFMISRAMGGLLLDPGFGKTAITLASFKILKQERIVKRMLVVAPIRPMQLVWPEEVRKWSDFNHFKMTTIHSNSGYKPDLVESKSDIFLMNPEGLAWLCSDSRLFNRIKADMLVVDELTKFKNTQTSRFQLLKQLLPRFDRRYGLTGSPNPNSYLDLFGQAYVLDMGMTLGQYITHYRNRYFYKTGQYGWELRDGAAEEIQKAIAPLMLRLDIEDYIDMPKEITRQRWVTLPPSAREVYDEMEQELFAIVDEKYVEAINEASASTKCRQIANGGLYSVDEFRNRDTHQVHEEKTGALMDLIEEMQGEPLFVAYQYEQDLERIRKAMKEPKLPYIGGGVSFKRAKELVAEWNRGNLPVLLGQPASVGHGLNLQEGGAHHIAWYGLTWNFEDYDQFNRRLRRQGQQSRSVFVHQILASDTIDMAMLDALRTKSRNQAGFLAAMKRYRHARLKAMPSRTKATKSPR